MSLSRPPPSGGGSPRPRRRPDGAGGQATRALPPLHLLVDDRLLAAADLRERLDPVLAAGGSALALHLRARRVTARRLHDAASAITALARTHGATVVVNDRLDVALAVGAHGVHLREDSLPGGVARAIAGQGLWLGRSIHDPAQILAGAGGGGDGAGRRPAAEEGVHRAGSANRAGIANRADAGGRESVGREPASAEPADQAGSAPASPPIPATDFRALDYLVLGAIYPTRSHPGRAPIGTGALARAAARSDRPVLAIGGITPGRVAATRRCGAAGVVVRSGVWGAGGGAGAAVQRYLEALAK